MTCFVSELFEVIVEPEREIVDEHPLLAYSKGLLSRSEAVKRLGLRDYAELLVALGDADLPMPLPSPDEVDRQVATFSEIWKTS